jgi:hypothetical protein
VRREARKGGEGNTGFRWGKLSERDQLGDPGVDGRKILKWILRKCDGGMDYINPAQNRDG